MYKLDPVTLALKDKNNWETYIYYLKHTIEQDSILREIVEQAKSLNPLDSASYSACKYVKLIQELLGHVRDTCPNIHKPSENIVAVMSINKKKTVRSNQAKSKKQSHKPKFEHTNQEKLYLLHMDLCGPIRVVSVNRKKYILVIVDDYSWFTWVKFLASKDEAPDFIIKFLKMIQVRLNATVRNIRTDNGTEFVNQTLQDYYQKVRIYHETSVARIPQQNYNTSKMGAAEYVFEVGYFHSTIAPSQER
ncbi:retrovirus-related pol polyprotein from transposon TNT 1-94 [Tanacetum coccineum]